MATVPAFEAKTKFGELLDRVSKGEEIIITRHEKPVARLIGEAGPNRDDIQRAAEGLRSPKVAVPRSALRNILGVFLFLIGTISDAVSS